MRLFAILLALASASIQLRAAEHWIRITTPHFEMYTTNGQKQALAALRIFEQVRYFFLESTPSKSAPHTPVRIIAFRNEKEYLPYRLNEGAFAYYLRSRKVDYIVMGDISSEHHQTAIHEYTHLIAEHSGSKLPLWMNEGYADFYSSLEPKGDQARVGRPLEDRVEILLTQRWLSLQSLFDVGPDSPYYNEKAKMSIFYAESWALVHMIVLGENYRPGLRRFMTEIAAKHSAAECFQSVYGKNLRQVTADLDAYVHQTALNAAIYDVKLSRADLEPEVSDASDVSVNLALADLLASRTATENAARTRLTKLAIQYPDKPEVRESLGYLAWQQNDLAGTRENFGAAFERGSTNADMLLQYSRLLRESGAHADAIVPVLQKAVTLQPDFRDAWFDLGMTEVNASHWGAALHALSEVKTIEPDQAFSLFSALAYCDLRLKNLDQARIMAERARGYAKTPDEELRISNMLQHLDSMRASAQ